MYRRKFQSSRRASDSQNYEDTVHGQKDAKRPGSEGKVDYTLSFKALRGLPKSGSSIIPKVDPYTSVLPGSDPYALLNAMNRSIGGKYGGDDNLDGGNTQQFVTSESSRFLNCFDSFLMQLPINYRYLPINNDDTTRGKQFTNEMIKAISEVVSSANATTFTDLAAFTYEVETDMPLGDYSNVGFKNVSDPEGLFAWMIYYQIVLQDIAASITNFNKFRNNMGTMMRMSWNRETPKLNSYFGLTKKKSFIAQWQSLAYTIEGEYFDYEWMQQYNMINAITSRRADAMTEPLLELATYHVTPSITLKVGEDNIFEHSEMDAIMAVIGSAMPKGYEFTNFEGSLATLSLLLSINDTLAWVRNSKSSMTEQQRFNAISSIIQGLNECMNYFKPRMADVRTVFDVLSRIGINRWTKSVQLRVVKATDVPTLRNLTVENIYQMVGGGSSIMTWNAKTYRWSGHTMWNIYTGIPEYDAMSGGAFLSFSLKLKDNSGSTDAVKYLPVAFSTYSNILAIDRLGNAVTLRYTEFDATVNPTTCRLVPLPSMSVTMRSVYTSKYDSLTPIQASQLSQACVKIFGSFVMQKDETVDVNSNIQIESDNLCFVTYEIEDLSNEMISYARAKGPFMVNIVDTSRIGFLGLVGSNPEARKPREQF